MNHPALALGYRLEADGVSVVYACDHEPHSRQYALGTGTMSEQDRRHIDFIKGADLLIHDAQYTLSSFSITGGREGRPRNLPSHTGNRY